MIGSSVNKNLQAACAQYINQVSPAVTGLEQSTVTAPDLSTMTGGDTSGFSFQPDNGTTTLPFIGGGGISEFDKCKARIATSVSLMAAIIQVFYCDSNLELIS